jgi:hypothetical protein
MSEENETVTTYNLSDTAIAHIAKVLQVAILTGTDISDNLRQFELTEDSNGNLTISEDYTTTFNTNLEKMMDELETSKTSSEPAMEQIRLFE